MCSDNTGDQKVSRVQHLHPRDSQEEGQKTALVRSERPDKTLCGESHLQLAIPSCLDNITFVGAVVKSACLTLSFSSQEATQIELCVVEAVVNAIKHAYAGMPGHTVEIHVTTDVDRLTIQIRDKGQAMVQEMPAALDFDPSDIAQVPEGGMGLFLIQSLMDEVSYESHQGANILTMTRRRSP